MLPRGAHVRRVRGLTFELGRPWRQGALADRSNMVGALRGQGALPERVGSSEGLGRNDAALLRACG